MNVRVTQGAEGLARRAFTVDEIWRMLEAEIIGPDENFELIEGEIVPMAAKDHAHEHVKSALILAIARALPSHLWLGVESSIELSTTTFVEPDLAVYRKGLHLRDVRGSDVILAVEVSASTLRYDRGKKAGLYSLYGVRELWVVDANERRTWVHTGPNAQGWESVTEVPAGGMLRPQDESLRSLAMRLTDIA